MTKTLIYSIPWIGPVTKLQELKNPIGGAASVWTILGERFLPGKPWPYWETGDWRTLSSFVVTSHMSHTEKLVLCATLDYAVIETSHLTEMSNALRLFAHKYGMIDEPCELLDLAYALDAIACEVIRGGIDSQYGIGLRLNCASGDPWLVYDPEKDSYRPYNTGFDARHWPLFQTLDSWKKGAIDHLERQIELLEYLQEQRNLIRRVMLARLERERQEASEVEAV